MITILPCRRPTVIQLTENQVNLALPLFPCLVSQVDVRCSGHPVILVLHLLCDVLSIHPRLIQLSCVGMAQRMTGKAGCISFRLAEEGCYIVRLVT